MPLSRAAISPTAIETDQLRQSEFLRNAQNGLAQAFVRLATHSPTLSAGVSTAFERELDADPILTGKVYPELVGPFVRSGRSRERATMIPRAVANAGCGCAA